MTGIWLWCMLFHNSKVTDNQLLVLLSKSKAPGSIEPLSRWKTVSTENQSSRLPFGPEVGKPANDGCSQTVANMAMGS